MDKEYLAGIKAYLEEIKKKDYSHVFPMEFEKDIKWMIQACDLLIKDKELRKDDIPS